MIELSIVIITFNNYLLKNGCIESALFSLDRQYGVDFEVVVVDNCSTENDYNKLSQFLRDNYLGYNVKLIRNSINNISRGRNLGIYETQGDIILFLDDDILLLQRDILLKVVLSSKEKVYGCAAIRDWTSKGWYATNKENLDINLKKMNGSVDISIQAPHPLVRKKTNLRHLVRSYIGNMGFVKRDILYQVGLWNEQFEGYGLEDDYMLFLLYINYGTPKKLTNIHVIHIWHEISTQNYNQLSYNQHIFNELLLKHNIKKFHVGRLLYGDGEIIEYIK